MFTVSPVLAKFGQAEEVFVDIRRKEPLVGVAALCGAQAPIGGGSRHRGGWEVRESRRSQPNIRRLYRNFMACSV